MRHLLSVLIVGSVVAATCWAHAAEPIESRTWSCYFAGGLIDGSCIRVAKDDIAVIKRDNGELVEVPLELFEAGQQEEIRMHFGIEAKEPVKVDAVSGGHPWHSSRGGVIVMGNIIGREGNLLFVADDKGQRLRIPYSLLASGAQDHARSHVSKLEGKPFKPAVEKLKIERTTASRPSPRVKEETPKPAQPAEPKPTPMPVASPTPPTTVPAIPGLPQPAPVRAIGESRKWRFRSGVVLAEGKFVEISGGQVRVQLADGEVRGVPIDILVESDRQYAETLAKGEQPSEAPKGAIEVAAENPQWTAAGDGSALYLVDGTLIHVLSPDGSKKLSTHDLGGEITQLASAGSRLVAAIGKELVLLDPKTLKVEAKHELWRYGKIRSFALHPTRPLAYASVENSREAIRRNSAERQRVVAVDLSSGDVTELEDVFGKFLAVDPAGKFLFVGYAEVYEDGATYHINPGFNIIRNPNWENIDILIRYNIVGEELELDETFEDAGANGQGLVLSPDGKRVSYLSFTGFPTFSGNVALFDAANFKRKPVTLAMKDKSDCRRMVHHPSLDLVASPTTGGAVLYKASTGEVLEVKLPVTAELDGAIIHAIAFAPDGKHLAMVVSKGGGARYVQSVALKLSAEEALQAAAKMTMPKSPSAPVSRTWKDKTGAFSVEATFGGIEADKVVLKKADGTVLRVPLDRLSPADRKYVAEQK